MNHIRLKSTAKAMYSALTVTYENKAHQTVNHIQCLLYEMKAHEGEDLLKHLDTLKSYHNCINKFPNADFHVSDIQFKSIISVSLPSTWQTFIDMLSSMEAEYVTLSEAGHKVSWLRNLYTELGFT
jgi:hypothetical protein